jgi:phosphoribosylformimino-5-aminoimidazole carboxamide ribotide isomerase
MKEETVFSEFPDEMAEKWYAKGAERLHLVDLNGAVEGRPVNKEVIERVTKKVPIPVQLGGGIRDLATVKSYFDLGVRYAILGTVAFKDPDMVARGCEQFPGQIMVGIDVRKDRVALEGWTEEVDVRPAEMARRFEKMGVCAIVYTDIQRDGMRTGPNIEGTRALARAVQIPVIASGGISGISDVSNIVSLEKEGVIGMITGRALYEGSLNLAEAIRIGKGQERG